MKLLLCETIIFSKLLKVKHDILSLVAALFLTALTEIENRNWRWMSISTTFLVSLSVSHPDTLEALWAL